MDVGTVVSWIQVAIWIVAIIIFIVRVVRGEARLPALLNNNLLLGIVIALGICGSVASLYLHYHYPRIVVVEKQIPASPCPAQQPQSETLIPKIPVAKCPPGVPVLNLGSIVASDNQGCGVNVSGNVCLNSDGQWFLLRNVKDGMCIDSNGDVKPKQP